VLGDARKQSNRDLNGFGAASKEANFITELHLESTLAAAASIRAGQGTSRAATYNRARQERARAAAPFGAGQEAAREQSTNEVHGSDLASWLMMRREMALDLAGDMGEMALDLAQLRAHSRSGKRRDEINQGKRISRGFILFEFFFVADTA
jgi:hypothetical protein